MSQLVLALAIGILVAYYGYSVYSTFEKRWNYLTWDPAAHAWDGMRLALDIRKFDVAQLVLHTNQLVLWPPLHSYLQVPYYLTFGFDFHAAVLCSLTFLALFPVALTWLQHQYNPSWPGWIVLMALTVSSPLLLGYGTMPMLEIFGAALTAWSAALFLRRSYWFPLSLALLFFLKYNYFVYLALALAAASLSSIEFRRVTEIIRPPKILLLFLAIFSFLAVIILVSGGFKAGSVSVRGIGNPAYFFFLIALLALLWKRQNRATIWSKMKGSGWEWFFIPVVVWLLIPVPNRVKTILSFAVSRPLGSPPASSLDYYLYYFEKLPLYFGNEWIAWLAVVIFIFLTVLYRNKIQIRFVSSLFLLPFFLMTLNQNKQERYLFTFIPAVWILLAFGASRIPWKSARWGTALLVVATIAATSNLEIVNTIVRGQFIALRARTPLHFISERIADAPEIRVLGATNELNPAMIQYHSARRSGFQMEQNFEWEIERQPTKDLHIICIDCEAAGTLLKMRTFQGGLVVRHSFLDTSEGAPYNPGLVPSEKGRQ